MKNFLTTIRNTFYNRDFYHDVLREKSLEKTATFYLKCGVVFALGVLVFLLFGLYSFFKQDFQTGISRTLALYPNELTLSFNNGELSSNMPPLAIPLYQSVDESADLVIDTSVDSVDVSKYAHSVLLFGKKFVTIVRHNQFENSVSEVRQYPYAQFGLGQLTITKASIESYIPKLISFVKILFVFLLILLPVFFTFFKLIGIWIWALVLALMFWAILSLLKREAGFKGAYIVALYASISALIITSVLSLFIGHISLLFSLIALFTFLLNFLPRKSHI